MNVTTKDAGQLAFDPARALPAAAYRRKVDRRLPQLPGLRRSPERTAGVPGGECCWLGKEMQHVRRDADAKERLEECFTSRGR